MKKYILLFVFLACCQWLMAQEVSYTVQGGANLPSIAPAAPQSGGGGPEAHLTFQFGGMVNIAFKQVSIETGLLLNGKGNRSTTTEYLTSNGNPVPYSLTHLTSITYLELPVNLLYHKSLKAGVFYAGGGPYIARALWGSFLNKSRINTYYNRSATTNMDFGSGADQIRPMDYGLNFAAGLKMPCGIKLGLNYGLGLNNLATGLSSQNRVGSLVVGYQFK